MEIFFLLYIIFMVVVLIILLNGVLTLPFVIRPIMNRYLDSPFDANTWFWGTPNSVDQVYDYHAFWKIKNWFGFRHYFFPWKEPVNN